MKHPDKCCKQIIEMCSYISSTGLMKKTHESLIYRTNPFKMYSFINITVEKTNSKVEIIILIEIAVGLLFLQ